MEAEKVGCGEGWRRKRIQATKDGGDQGWRRPGMEAKKRIQATKDGGEEGRSEEERRRRGTGVKRHGVEKERMQSKRS